MPITPLTTLATFNGTNGSFPAAGLIADASGNLYGTTFRGGLKGDGTVLEVANNANHTLSTLVMFSGANGANPRARLIADASGNLYGTTYGGGGKWHRYCVRVRPRRQLNIGHASIRAATDIKNMVLGSGTGVSRIA